MVGIPHWTDLVEKADEVAHLPLRSEHGCSGRVGHLVVPESIGQHLVVGPELGAKALH